MHNIGRHTSKSWPETNQGTDKHMKNIDITAEDTLLPSTASSAVRRVAPLTHRIQTATGLVLGFLAVHPADNRPYKFVAADCKKTIHVASVCDVEVLARRAARA